MPDRPALMPADTPDYMAPAWAACISWAIGNADIMAAYRAETGDQWEPARSGLERMIDDACGAGDAFCARFTAWANVAVWGPMEDA